MAFQMILLHFGCQCFSSLHRDVSTFTMILIFFYLSSVTSSSGSDNWQAGGADQRMKRKGGGSSKSGGTFTGVPRGTASCIGVGGASAVMVSSVKWVGPPPVTLQAREGPASLLTKNKRPSVSNACTAF